MNDGARIIMIGSAVGERVLTPGLVRGERDRF
jgi:hypothetical protein